MLDAVIDKFVNWGWKDTNWPILLLLLIPLWYTFFKNYFSLNFRDTLNSVLFLFITSIILLLSGCLFLVWNFHHDTFYIGLIIISVGIILFIIACSNALPPVISDDNLVIAIAKFTPISKAAEEEADNLAHRIEQQLLEKIRQGAPIKVKRIEIKVYGQDDEEKNNSAISYGRKNRAHIVIWGDVRKDGDELFIKPHLTVSIQMNKKKLKDKRINEFVTTEPNNIEFKERVSKELADIPMFLYAYANYKLESYDKSIEIFDHISNREAEFYLALSLLNKSETSSEPTIELSKSIQIFEKIIDNTQSQTSSYDNKFWIYSKVNLANVKALISEYSKGEDCINHLQDAVAIYKSVLDSGYHFSDKSDFHIIKLNLGTSQQRLGEKISDSEGRLLIDESIQNLKSAVNDLKDTSQDDKLAAAYNNLAIALRALANRTKGHSSIEYLNESLQVYDLSIKIYNKLGMQMKWAMAQNNLGITLYDLGIRHEGSKAIKYLTNSIKAFRLALKSRTKSETPLQWADTLSNLSISVRELGKQETGKRAVELLNEAIKYCQNALEVRRKEVTPQQWADTQMNLGLSLIELGIKLDDEESIEILSQSVETFHQILKIRTRSNLPLQWATTQINLGLALKELGLKHEGDLRIEKLRDSISATKSALEIINLDNKPDDWAIAQVNLAETLCDLSLCENQSIDLFKESVVAYQSGLSYYTKTSMPNYWASIHNNLGYLLKKLGCLSEGNERIQYLNEALNSFRYSLEVFDRALNYKQIQKIESEIERINLCLEQ